MQAQEVLAMFELQRIIVSYHLIDTVQFQVFGALQRMNLIEFSIRMGIYDAEFIRTPTYDALLVVRPGEESQEDCWQWLSMDSRYDPQRSKATSLRSPVLRFIHSLLSHTLTGHGYSIIVVNQRDFKFLLSFVGSFHLHLRQEPVLSIYHQGTDPRVGVLFVGPYISRLVPGMGLLEGTQRMRIVGGYTPIISEILRFMGMLCVTHITRGTEYRVRDVATTIALAPNSPLAPIFQRSPLIPLA